MNSYVSAEKAHEPLPKSDVFHNKKLVLLSASVSLSGGTESITGSSGSALDFWAHFLPGFLGASSSWLSVIAPCSCSSQRVSRSQTGTQNSTTCTSDPIEDFSTHRPAHPTRSFIHLLWSSEQLSHVYRETALQLPPHSSTFFLSAFAILISLHKQESTMTLLTTHQNKSH